MLSTKDEVKEAYLAGKIDKPEALTRLKQVEPNLWCIWDRYRVIERWESEARTRG